MKEKTLKDYLKKYQKLTNRRDNLANTYNTSVEQLIKKGILPGTSAKNLDEHVARISEWEKAYEIGKKNLSELNPDEKKTYKALSYLSSIDKKIDDLTFKILAIRQGLINRCDKNESRLGNIGNKYSSIEDFCNETSDDTKKRFEKLVKKYSKTQRGEDTDLILMDSSQQNIEKSIYDNMPPYLQEYIDTIRKINETEPNKNIPLSFERGILEGEVVISSPEELEKKASTENFKTAYELSKFNPNNLFPNILKKLKELFNRSKKNNDKGNEK